ncbi:MAG: hypothetical protein NTZ78_05290 [Candidatus Aureabacteria bacterium]|nr:hypothetical protein [Candidatus Auribacterota bacterium]
MLKRILLSRSKRTVTTDVLLSGLIHSFSNLHRFLSQYVGDVEQLALTILSFVLRHLPANAPLISTLDDTNVRKTGQKIFEGRKRLEFWKLALNGLDDHIG